MAEQLKAESSMLSVLDTVFVAVGVSGHRRLASSALPCITEQTEHLLKQLRHQLTKTVAKNCQCNLSVYSCLSEGADRLVARAGLKHDYNLYAVLPFPLNSPINAMDLVGDEQIKSRQELHELCTKAKSLIELDRPTPAFWSHIKGFTPAANDSSEYAESFRQEAYAEATYAVVDSVDVLIAIWNGQPQLSNGGTYDAIVKATERHIPVVVIDSLGQKPPRLITSKEDIFSEGGCISLDLIAEKLVKSVTPSADIQSLISKCADDLRYCQTQTLPKLASSWNKFQKSLTKHQTQKLGSSPYKEDTDPDFRLFDHAANFYASLQRSSFLEIATLSILAVVWSAIGAAWPDAGSHYAAVIIFGIMQILTVVLTLREVRKIQKKRWQQKFTEYRFIAEVLRLNSFAKSFAVPCRYSDRKSLYELGSESWVDYLLKALLRSKVQAHINLSNTAYIAEQSREIESYLLDSQRGYHAVNSLRSYLVERKLEKLSMTMFWMALAIAIINLSMTVLSVQGYLVNILIFFGTLCPVIAISAQSVSQNAELKRLYMRSSILEDKLTGYLHAFKDSEDLSEKRRIVEAAVTLMLTESNDWKAQYKIQNVNV